MRTSTASAIRGRSFSCHPLERLGAAVAPTNPSRGEIVGGGSLNPCCAMLDELRQVVLLGIAVPEAGQAERHIFEGDELALDGGLGGVGWAPPRSPAFHQLGQTGANAGGSSPASTREILDAQLGRLIVGCGDGNTRPRSGVSLTRTAAGLGPRRVAPGEEILGDVLGGGVAGEPLVEAPVVEELVNVPLERREVAVVDHIKPSPLSVSA